MSPFEQLVQDIGGPTALAEAIGGTVKAQHIVNWRQRGVPHDRVKDIIRGARAKGCDVPPSDLRPDLYPAGFRFNDEDLAAA